MGFRNLTLKGGFVKSVNDGVHVIFKGISSIKLHPGTK